MTLVSELESNSDTTTTNSLSDVATFVVGVKCHHRQPPSRFSAPDDAQHLAMVDGLFSSAALRMAFAAQVAANF